MLADSRRRKEVGSTTYLHHKDKTELAVELLIARQACLLRKSKEKSKQQQGELALTTFVPCNDDFLLSVTFLLMLNPSC